jgi:hypothetical protein
MVDAEIQVEQLRYTATDYRALTLAQEEYLLIFF